MNGWFEDHQEGVVNVGKIEKRIMQENDQQQSEKSATAAIPKGRFKRWKRKLTTLLPTFTSS